MANNSSVQMSLKYHCYINSDLQSVARFGNTGEYKVGHTHPEGAEHSQGNSAVLSESHLGAQR